MIHDSGIHDALALQSLPSVLLDTRSDRVLGMNETAAALFGPTCPDNRFSRLLKTEVAQFAVFLDAVAHYRHFADRSVEYHGATPKALRLQTYGRQVSDGRVLLSFLDLDELDRRNHVAEQEAHHRAGLTQWQNIYRFFREVEAQNHLILEAAGEGIYGINADGKATFVNRAAQEMLGWSSDDLVGQDLHSIIHGKYLNGEHFPAHKCPIYASFRNDQTVHVDDDVFWRKDGKPILVEYVSTPIYDHGVLAGAVVIFRDVTERKENERKLREALEEVETLRDRLERENDYLLTEIRSARSHTGIVGVSPAIKTLNAQIDLAARNNTNILVSGPAGSGKALAVSAIHEASDRRKRPLVRVSCADKSVQELEAELFGYRRGAFRGATQDVTGKLMLANNGTLHLDEVSEMPKEVQGKFMSALQDRRFRRLGDTVDHPMALSIVSTTSRNLLSDVQAGRFRQDLYFALNVFPITCDALRNRPEDIPYLAKHFLERSVQKLRLPATRLTKANIDALQDYDWPGNVRELENVVERAAILAQGGKLKLDLRTVGTADDATSDAVLTQAELRKRERDNLTRALRRAGGKVSGAQGAAKLLGLAPTTVYSKLKAFELDAGDFK
ncbi:MAG: sigma 54-interacting transcriptional regulator [Pseudomonadota bacterium]